MLVFGDVNPFLNHHHRFFWATASVVGNYRVAVDRVPESSTSRRVHRWLPPRMESGPDHVENNMVTTQPSNEIEKKHIE